MSWEDQGRQDHGHFGHGTGGTTPDAATRGVAVRLGSAAVGALPAPQRSRFESWLGQGGVDQVASVLPG